MTEHNLLLIEDDDNLARFLELELSSEGYGITVAKDGLSGLMAARERIPRFDFAGLDATWDDWG